MLRKPILTPSLHSSAGTANRIRRRIVSRKSADKIFGYSVVLWNGRTLVHLNYKLIFYGEAENITWIGGAKFAATEND